MNQIAVCYFLGGPWDLSKRVMRDPRSIEQAVETPERYHRLGCFGGGTAGVVAPITRHLYKALPVTDGTQVDPMNRKVRVYVYMGPSIE